MGDDAESVAEIRDVFLADANVLIDYLQVGIAVLGKYSLHVGKVFVPRLILDDEVKGLDADECRRVGLEVVDIEPEVLLEAAIRAEGLALSFHDWVCVLESRRRAAICLTSDAALIKVCEQQGVRCKRGLAILLELVSLEVLAAESARGFARVMIEANPYLRKVAGEFERRLSEIEAAQS